MQDFIIIGILVVVLGIGIYSIVKKSKSKSSCCGSGGNTYVAKKKLKHVIATRTFIVDGMTCENCKDRVESRLNDLDGVMSKVNLKTKEVVVSMEKEVSDDVICATIEKAGYTVVEIR